MVMDPWLSIGGKDEEEKWFSTFMVESGSTTRGHDGKVWMGLRSLSWENAWGSDEERSLVVIFFDLTRK